jgi:hypothetical protein
MQLVGTQTRHRVSLESTFCYFGLLCLALPGFAWFSPSDFLALDF